MFLEYLALMAVSAVWACLIVWVVLARTILIQRLVIALTIAAVVMDRVFQSSGAMISLILAVLVPVLGTSTWIYGKEIEGLNALFLHVPPVIIGMAIWSAYFVPRLFSQSETMVKSSDIAKCDKP